MSLPAFQTELRLKCPTVAFNLHIYLFLLVILVICLSDVICGGHSESTSQTVCWKTLEMVHLTTQQHQTLRSTPTAPVGGSDRRGLQAKVFTWRWRCDLLIATQFFWQSLPVRDRCVKKCFLGRAERGKRIERLNTGLMMMMRWCARDLLSTKTAHAH